MLAYILKSQITPKGSVLSLEFPIYFIGDCTKTFIVVLAGIPLK